MLLFLGGGGTQLLENIGVYDDRAKAVIADEDRRDQARDVLDSMKERTEARNEMVKDAGEELGELIEDQGVADAQLDAVWDQYMTEIAAYHRDMIDLRFELKQQVNREEWQAIFAAPQ